MDLNDYLVLIPAPNNIQPLFMAWEEGNFQPLVDGQAVMDAIPEAFSIDTATGVQLDLLGEILQVSRTVNFQPGGGFSPVLSDEDYRLVLKAKIIKNQWKGTKKEIYDFWALFFPESPVIIQDNQDMSMTVIVVNMPNNLEGTIVFGYDVDTADMKGYDLGYWGGFQSLRRDLITKGYLVPKPAGVSTNFTFIEDAVFGYDTDSALVKGYDQGEWISF